MLYHKKWQNLSQKIHDRQPPISGLEDLYVGDLIDHEKRELRKELLDDLQFVR